jgi:hypothetical protein
MVFQSAFAVCSTGQENHESGIYRFLEQPASPRRPGFEVHSGVLPNTMSYASLLQRVERDGEPRLVPIPSPASHSIPCPSTGRALKVATIDAAAQAICPSCLQNGRGAFVSFVSDLRMAYACPRCEQFVWVAAV